jgi:hypothetical protein
VTKTSKIALKLPRKVLKLGNKTEVKKVFGITKGLKEKLRGL